MFWLLTTGELPTPHEYEEIMLELKKRGKLSDDVKEFINYFPKEMSAMTQLSSVLLYLQPNSLYQQAISQDLNQNHHWQYAVEDCLNLIAMVPQIAAYIYRHKFKNNQYIERNPDLDWAGNFAHMLGFNTYEFREFLRGHLALHAYSIFKSR